MLCMIVLFVIEALPEMTINGKLLADQISSFIESFAKTGFIVRGVVTDNHNSNVNAFTRLKREYGQKDQLLIKHPKNHGKKTYLFYDTVHLMKNIRNNLLNGKRFVFPEFIYTRKMGLISIVLLGTSHGRICTEFLKVIHTSQPIVLLSCITPKTSLGIIR